MNAYYCDLKIKVSFFHNNLKITACLTKQILISLCFEQRLKKRPNARTEYGYAIQHMILFYSCILKRQRS